MESRKHISHNLYDDAGRRLPFVIIPANNAKESPLLIAFHGWTGGLAVERNFDTLISPAHVNDFPDNWNILIPQDRYGFGRCGCWWLGEKGEFFLADLLDGMIRLFNDHFGFNGEIYVFGISMGGFGALLHGLRWKARAVCVNVPQVRLLNTDFTGHNHRTLKAVFGKDAFERLMAGDAQDDPGLARLAWFSNATNFLDADLPRDQKTTFLIAQFRYDITPNYTKEQCLYLVDKLIEKDFNFELTIRPECGHWECIKVLDAIRWFEEKRDIIRNGVANRFDPENDPNALFIKKNLEQYENDLE